MCGIVGFTGVFDDNLLELMINSVAHRGPDNIGTFRSGFGGVAHSRLSIVDLSVHSNQPIMSSCGRYVIVFNGEIYNFKELRQQLIEEKSVVFASEGDAEVILYLFVHYGVGAFDRLDGIFSFAIMDLLKEEILAVRDPFGVKPLYYASAGDGILFGSEIKALLQSPSVSRNINFSALARYLNLMWSPGSETILASVFKVKPGFCLTFKGGAIVHEVQYSFATPYVGDASTEASVSAVESALVKSVSTQLLADVEIGAFLSGGLDSSLICAIAKEHDTSFSKVFTISNKATDESSEGVTRDLPFATLVASELGLKLHEVEVDSDEVKLLPEVLYYLDEPQSDPAIISTYKICQLAKQKGLRVLLSGAGGDDVYSGYRRHIALRVGKLLDFMPPEVWSLASKVVGVKSLPVSFTRRATKFIESQKHKGLERLFRYFSWQSPDYTKSLFSPGKLASNFDMYSIFSVELSGSSDDVVEQCLQLDRQFFLTDHNLNYTDKMGMAHGIEVRVPFVTKRHFEAASTVPTQLKLRGRQGKWILKHVAEKWLPKSVIYRPKTGFGSPVRSWLKGPLSALVDGLLSEDVLGRRGIFDMSRVRQMIEEDRSGDADHAYTIYALISFEVWAQQYLDVDRPTVKNFNDLY